MATESFLVTVLPRSASPTETVHLSLFVTHRLTPDGPAAVLGDFANVVQWTTALADAQFTLFGRPAVGPMTPIPATAALGALQPAWWPAVFPADLPVRGWVPRDHTAAPWRTFAAHRMQSHALLAHAASIFSSPVGAPTVRGNALTVPAMNSIGLGQFTRRLGVKELFNPEVPLDRWATDHLDDLTGRGVLGEGISLDTAAAGAPLAILATDVHRARRYYQPDDPGEYHERPVDGAKGVPLHRPDPDFHERAGMLGDQSLLLRGLGLVIDVHVDDLAALAGVVELQAIIEVPGLDNATPNHPRTSCTVTGEVLAATSASGDYTGPLLRLGDEERFTVLDLDPDASALKLEQYVRTLPRMLAAETNGDATNSAPPTLRATGFAIARNDRASALHDRLDDVPARTAAMLAGTAPPLQIEEITRGVRLEVWDDATNHWHSLHHRRLDVSVDGIGELIGDAPDVGFLQGAALTRDDGPDGGVDGSTVKSHEVMAGWDGWSLAVPRPGKLIVHEDGAEVLKDAPDPDPSPVNPVQSTSRIEPLTLPWLRYGRSYAFRAWAVDLAGNSAPHPVVGPAQPTVRARALAAGGVPPDVVAVAAARLGGLDRDATAVRGVHVRQRPLEAVREQLRVLLPPSVPGPSERRPGAQLDLTSLTVTGDADVDSVLRQRLNARRRMTSTQAPSRRANIEALFADHAVTAAHLLERTDTGLAPETFANAMSSAVAHGQLSVAAGNLVALLADLITTPRPFLRWDPVIEPVVVPRHRYTEAESLLTLVIRSGVEKPAVDGGLDVTLVAPAAYAAQVLAAHPELDLAWRGDSQRHLAPPKTSQFESELHGKFDAAFGPAAAGAVRDALAVALRESGTFLDTTVADLTQPGARLPQPGVAFFSSPTAEVPAAPTPDDLARGDALTPGQYVVHDVDQLVLPYLPDPLAAGLSMVFPDAGQGHHLFGLFAIEGVTHRYDGDWPALQPARLVLEAGDELAAAIVDDVITMRVPPGEQLRFRLSSSLDRDSLDLLGLWRSLPAALRDLDVLAAAAADGWLWWLTPATEIRLVHAVPRPVEVPRPTILVPVRTAGDTAVALVGGVDVHGPSTERIDLEASWSEWVDDVTTPAPRRIDVKAAAADASVAYDDDIVIVAGADQVVPLPDGSTLTLHRMVHQLGDTRHRDVDYRFRATTRYREYFDPRVLPAPDDMSMLGPVRRIDVPSTARPPKPIVRDVLPLFRWFEETEPAQPFGLRRERRTGLRLYLDRPWYASGDGELLGVVLAVGSDALVTDHVSQWGADPVFWQQGPAQRAALPLVDLLHLTGLDDRRQAARPVGPPVARQLVDVKGEPAAWVLGYEPEFSDERGMWFVDLALDPGTAFWPFVRLCVVRMQPSSLARMHLSAVVRCDPVQLPPERVATLSRPEEREARVTITGPVGVPRLSLGGTDRPDFLQMLLASRTMRARLERRIAEIPTDLGWESVATLDLPILGIDGTTVSWAGTFDLPQAIEPVRPGDSSEWRVTVEEWERLPADPLPSGAATTEARIVYADHLPL